MRNEGTEMSKFLKIIVNLVVIGSILVAAALLIPPVAGINTVMSDNSTSGTNLPVGAVAYGKTVETDALKKGDKVIYTTNNQAYVYEITDMDASAGAYNITDCPPLPRFAEGLPWNHSW